MLKSISNLGTILSRTEQKHVHGGGPGDPDWCDNPDNWGPGGALRACRRGQERVFSVAHGYCICKSVAVNM